MAIEVWADVGGTFTDCFVTDDDNCRVIKVLSSGVVRATGQRLKNACELRLQLPASHMLKQFWVGARLSQLEPDGSPMPLGTIINFDGKTGVLSLDRPPDRVRGETDELFEIDPQLEAPVLGARLLLRIPLRQPLPPLEVRLGTTRGTNALLTRSGAETVLLITKGFRDALLIGEQDRPDLFALTISKTKPLTQRVVEVDERVTPSGETLRPLNEAAVRERLGDARAAGAVSVAICFLHGHAVPGHEERCVQLAREVGFTEISRSSEVAPLIKLVSRAETTTLDAYLNPVLRQYVERVQQQFGGPNCCRLRLMTSGGNLVGPEAFRGRDSILSGPAGGVIGLAEVARRCRVDSAIGLDMGGTSTDVSRFQGRVGRRYETRVSGVRVMTPMMDIHTVAAGGGSVCDYRGATSDAGSRLTVGPESGGADPGPACYGRGGPLTLTDVNLLLGRIPPDRFPFPLDRPAAQRRLQEVAEKMDPPPGDLEPLADGFLQIAVTHMAEAVRAVSTAEGSDVRDMSLVGFGGAAGQHLCRVADALGIKHIIDHPDAAMLSALGIGLAKVGRVVATGIYKVIDREVVSSLHAIVDNLRDQADEALRSEHDGTGTVAFQFECDLRTVGTESSLQIELHPIESLGQRFHRKHQQTFGYVRQDREVELVAVRCEATLESRPTAPPYRPEAVGESAKVALWHQDRFLDAVCLGRESVKGGDRISAPALIASDTSTLIVEPGWQARGRADGIIELLPADDSRPVASVPAAVAARSQTTAHDDDPVLVEIVARRLQGIADAMGETLRRTAVSVNVKERRDYSCAVFRGDGSLVANAPHVPVHLGAMGHTVRHLIDAFPRMFPGDCFVTNDPYAGGSHLPDVTVVTPVFCNQRNATSPETPDFFVASRAHHAEIGGRTPGSMPPDANSLAEEGVVIRDFALTRNGRSHEDDLRKLLASGRYPSRNVAENMADVAAQQAAGHHGATQLSELAARYGVTLIDRMMVRLMELAGDAIVGWIRTLPEETLSFRDSLDDGTPIHVSIRRNADRLSIDFSGTAPVHPHGFNATPAIVTAAVMYVLRSVTGSELPLCDGVLREIDLHIPSGLLDPPVHPAPEDCAAVVAGNVETSQRIVDVLLGALGVAAASQGTMNNLLLGDESFGYYETIGGGSGATADGPGADAVHTHMTNTRITDPEVLESRLPLRLHRFAIRRGSGGPGRLRGGDGIVRELEFLRPLTVSLITGRRLKQPYGMSGGSAGLAGKNQLISKSTDGDTSIADVGPCGTFDVTAGDRLRIETPGGGGWGVANDGS